MTEFMMWPSRPLAEIGLTLCYFVKQEKYGPTRWAPDFPGVGPYETQFLFAPSTFPEELKGRLIFINISPNNRHFDTVVSALTSKYGSPTSQSQNVITTGMGAKLDNYIMSWSNDVSTIRVEKYAGSIEAMSLRFSIVNGDIEIGKLLEKKTKAAADKL